MRMIETRRLIAAFIWLASMSTVTSRAGDFTVTSGDKTFRLADARGKYVALHFLLKTECPYCQRTVTEYSRLGPSVAGVVQVFLKPDSDDEIAQWSSKLTDAGIAATIFRDPDAKLAEEFKVPGGYAFHGQTVHFPALVLIGPDGAEVFRHVGKDTTDRLPFEKFAAKVAELSRNPALKEFNLSGSEPAIKGYDPVSYIDSGAAQTGKSEFASAYRGVTYRFASPENRAKFAANPERYLPTYGGWCATAMADGNKVDIDPTNFKVTDGRLFLFYKGWLGNAQNDWNKDEKNLTAKADANWHKIAPSAAMERK